MIIHLFQWLVRTVGLLGILLFLYLNICLYDTPKCSFATIEADLEGRLHFLKSILHENNAGESAQALYPEGFVFIYALYALAWCDAVEGLPPEFDSRQEAVEEILYSLQQMDSPLGKAVFNPLLSLEYGAFYRGWTAYVRGRYLQIGGKDSLVSQQYEADCTAIALAIEETQKPYLESYDGLCWPADNVVCLAALSLHDRISKPQFEVVRAAWLERIKSTLLPDYQLIPHGYNLERNSPLESVRGSSQALILAFLPEIDPEFSQSQYQAFRKHFLDYRLGLPGIREYPHGTSGLGDIDSGPVVMGIGGAASIVGIRATSLQRDWAVAEGLSSGTNALLFSFSDGKEKCYLFGQLPILDAFVAWANAKKCGPERVIQSNWRWKFQTISFILISFLLWTIWKTRKGKV
ncbi:MAG: hypothetical protein ACKVU0_09715 [Saprospiraceae bacterium]